MARSERVMLALAIGLLAGAALAYQVLLFRLLAIIQWQPFAAMIISLALLGHGAAGTALALSGPRLLPRFHAVFAMSAALFGAAVPLCWSIAQRLPFNGLELVWNTAQLGWLAGIFMLLALPFFFAACCFGLAFMHARDRIASLYAADLLGAGIGAGLATGMLFLLPADPALRVAAIAGAAAACLVPARSGLRLALPALAAAVALTTPQTWLAPRITEFKGLPRTLAIHGSEIVGEYSSAYGLLTLVRNNLIPFRHAPGRGPAAIEEVPAQIAVFTDGDGMSAITVWDGRRESLAFLDETTSALPYRLLERPRIALLGTGGGAGVLQALYHDARAIRAVDPHPTMLELARARIRDPRIRWHHGEGRSFARTDGNHYDLVQVSPLDQSGGSGAGAQAVEESHAFTVEALDDYYARLAPGGLIAVTRPVEQPPRQAIKLFATAVEMLDKRGLEPRDRLVLIRGWQTATLLVKRGVLSAADIASVRRFCEERGFDAAWLPGIDPSEVNRRHRVPRPWLHEAAMALLGDDAGRFLESYKFSVEPATDDRPYFFHSFRWSLLQELVALRGQGGLTLLDSGYLVLAGTIVVAAVLSLALILAPLSALGRLPAGGARLRPAIYFLCLGLGFLFVEIACMQRYGLFIGYRLFATVAVIAGFLVFAGAGSLAAARLGGCRKSLGWVVAGIVALLAVQVLALPPPHGAVESTSGRIVTTLTLVAPLAFLMGMPFPIGLSRLAAEAPAFIPWAWGINGCASVLAALVAALLAVHVGFSAVLLLAAALYVVAAIAWYSP